MVNIVLQCHKEGAYKIYAKISGFASGIALLCAAECYDIIIMDIKMAGLDGMDTMRRLVLRSGRP